MPAQLTDANIRSAKRVEAPTKRTDGNGLYLLVMPSGAKFWRFRYRIRGKENVFAIGTYPEMSLAQARASRDAARQHVKAGNHPSQVRKKARQDAQSDANSTFENVARRWVKQQEPHWSAYYAKQVSGVLENDVFPVLGASHIREVRAKEMLAILQRVSDRGAVSIAILIRQWCSAIFRFAIAHDHDITSDPTTALRGALRRPRTKHKTALQTHELPELLARVRGSRSAEHIRIALELLLLTFVRPGELRQGQWSEFDLEGREWRIPAERMKMRAPHVVPLSDQAVALLRRLRDLPPKRVLLFPNTRDPRRAMSATTLNRTLERLGYGGKFSAHGFRATASTILNERGYRPDVIERQLAHRERNAVRASYNHATYMVERRALMQEWADYVGADHANSHVVPLRRSSAA